MGASATTQINTSTISNTLRPTSGSPPLWLGNHGSCVPLTSGGPSRNESPWRERAIGRLRARVHLGGYVPVPVGTLTGSRFPEREGTNGHRPVDRLAHVVD